MKRRGQELHHRPELRQYMLPTLVYYLKLIELPNLEVETYLRHEIESNPMLEETVSDNSDDNESGDPEEGDGSVDKEIDMDDISFMELFSEATQLPTDRKEYDFDPIENVPAQDDRLYDILMRQARDAFTGNDLELAQFIISNIEDDGYLAITPEDICTNGYIMDNVTAIIAAIQHFDPIGCAWRDVREPLLIQLSHAGYSEDSIEYMLVRDYFKELQCNTPRDIIKSMDITTHK